MRRLRTIHLIVLAVILVIVGGASAVYAFRELSRRDGFEAQRVSLVESREQIEARSASMREELAALAEAEEARAPRPTTPAGLLQVLAQEAQTRGLIVTEMTPTQRPGTGEAADLRVRIGMDGEIESVASWMDLVRERGLADGLVSFRMRPSPNGGHGRVTVVDP
ncbi:MAG: hypothetical protein AAFU70_09230, partial [Planctomycetota bacterium]